jgi:glutathione S-transferase
MKLFGNYDSPFVRRVAIVMHYHSIQFENCILSTYSNFDELMTKNPLGTVPVLNVDAGDHLTDSTFMIDYLEDRVLEVARLLPRTGRRRFAVLQIEAIAVGLAEKCVALSNERNRRASAVRDQSCDARLCQHIRSALRWLESLAPTPWVYGSRMTLPDVTVAVTTTYLTKKLSGLANRETYPCLFGHNMHCEQLSQFSLAPFP